MIISLRPKIGELRLLFENVIDRSAFNQPFIIKSRRAFHPVTDFAWRFSHQSESPPFDLEHVLEPCFGPAANRNVTANCLLLRVRLGNQRRETPAIADPENVNAISVDEVVLLERMKRRAITGELRFKIGFAANTFAVADALFINPK